jgi:hypothetical protein
MRTRAALPERQGPLRCTVEDRPLRIVERTLDLPRPHEERVERPIIGRRLPLHEASTAAANRSASGDAILDMIAPELEFEAMSSTHFCFPKLLPRPETVKTIVRAGRT